MKEEAAESSEPWPSELRVQNNGRLLRVAFQDGVVGSVSSERLRGARPCADKSRASEARRREAAIVEIEQISNCAVRIRFDDGDDGGVYTWRLLRALTTQ